MTNAMMKDFHGLRFIAQSRFLEWRYSASESALLSAAADTENTWSSHIDIYLDTKRMRRQLVAQAALTNVYQAIRRRQPEHYTRRATNVTIVRATDLGASRDAPIRSRTDLADIALLTNDLADQRRSFSSDLELRLNRIAQH